MSMVNLENDNDFQRNLKFFKENLNNSIVAFDEFLTQYKETLMVNDNSLFGDNFNNINKDLKKIKEDYDREIASEMETTV